MWAPLAKNWLIKGLLLPSLATVAGGWALWWVQHEPTLDAQLTRKLDARLRAVSQGLAGDPAGRRQELAAAARDFAAAHGLPPEPVLSRQRALLARWESAEQSMARGVALVQAGRYRDAERELASASRSDPESAAAWSQLGAVLMFLGRFDDGRAAYDRALALAPDDAMTRYNFGLFFVRTANPEAAMAQFERAFSSPLVKTDTSLREALLTDLRSNPVLAEMRQRADLRRLLGD